MTYLLEFIPVDGGFDGHGGALKVLEACELEVGREYELVVTNNTGKETFVSES